MASIIKNIHQILLNGNLYNLIDKTAQNRINNLMKSETSFFTYEATDETTKATDVLPPSGNINNVYRLSNWNGIEYDPSAFSEYAWNGKRWILLSVKNNSLVQVITQEQYDGLSGKQKNSGTWYFIEEEE